MFEGEPFPAAKGEDRRAVYSARERVDGRLHEANCAGAVCAGAHASGSGRAAGNLFRCSKGKWCRSKTFRRWCTKENLNRRWREDIERKYEQFRQEFTVVYRKTLTLSREMASELSYLEQEAASVLVDGVIEELKEKYPGTNVGTEYLEEVLAPLAGQS